MLIRDPIYGDISLTDKEEKIVNTSVFDRMRRIKQLSFSEYVYPSATHNRYTHSIGVCETITEMYDSIYSKHPEVFKSGDRELLRMMALTHDMGHSPFSHSSEVLSDISHEERLTDILHMERKNIDLGGNNYGIEDWDLVNQVYNGEGLVYISDKHLLTLHSFMDGFIDADKMDYLVRDARNCGIKYGHFDRYDLIKYLTLLIDSNNQVRLGVEREGLQALESFILARYYMFSQVYFHPTRRLYDKLFIDEMGKILPDGQYPEDIKKFLTWDDTKIIGKLKFLNKPDWTLVYDSDFNFNVKEVIDKKLGEFLLCDTPRKGLFRKDSKDENIYIEDKMSGMVLPATSISAILRSIEYTNIHKLRYYAPSAVADKLKSEIMQLLRKEKLIW